MKKLFFLIGLSAFAFGADAQCDWSLSTVGTNGVCSTDPWVRVFHDDFDGDKLDKNIWVADSGVLRDKNFEMCKYWNLPQNVEVSGGRLKIRMKNETFTGNVYHSWTPPVFTTHTFSYTSGEIHTRYQYGYGGYYIKCKIPHGKGFWPAFWMFDGEHGWNEIDVFEFKNQYSGTPKSFDLDKSMRTHEMNTHHDFDGDGESENCGEAYRGPIFSADDHMFGLIWDPYSVDWSVDGLNQRRMHQYYRKTGITHPAMECYDITSGTEYRRIKNYPREEFMNVIVSGGISYGKNGVEAPDANTVFPNALEVDFITYYRQMACPTNLTFTQISQLGLVTNTPLHVADYILKIGHNILLNGNLPIAVDRQLDLRATQQIMLKPGFWAMPGCNFVATINRSLCPGAKSAGFGELLGTRESVSEEPVTRLLPQPAEPAEETKVYPNPSQDGLFRVGLGESDGPLEFTVYVRDLMGKLIKTEQRVTDGVLEVDLSAYPSGVYFLSMFDRGNNLIVSQKLIKE